jgi:methylase of polypeptide subunit release factors
MIKRKEVSPEVLTVLSEMVVDGSMLLQYKEKLPNEVYRELDTVLRAMGGKWRRGSKAQPAGHVFASDPTEQVSAVLATGDYACPRLNGCFYTPPGLARKVAKLAEVGNLDRVLEPSAGRGALALAVREIAPTAEITMVEQLPENARYLRSLDLGTVEEGPFNCEIPFIGTFDKVVMNPPFGQRQDVQHVLTAYGLLRSPGRLVAIMAAGIKFRGDRMARELRDLIRLWGFMEDIPEGTWDEAETKVQTVLVVIGKP